MSYNPAVKSLFFRGARRTLGRCLDLLDFHAREYLHKLECFYHRETALEQESDAFTPYEKTRFINTIGVLIAETALQQDVDNVAVRENVFATVKRLIHDHKDEPTLRPAISALNIVQAVHDAERTQLTHKLRQVAKNWLLRLDRRREAIEGCASPLTAAALHTLMEHALLPLSAFEASPTWTGLATVQRRLHCARDIVEQALTEQESLVSPSLTGNDLFDRLAAISTPLGFYEGNHLVVYDYDKMEVICGTGKDGISDGGAFWANQHKYYNPCQAVVQTRPCLWSTASGLEEIVPMGYNRERKGHGHHAAASSTSSEKDSGIEEDELFEMEELVL